jgi:4-hydroxy-4-methyl-2-oxoglutarate aldolase
MSDVYEDLARLGSTTVYEARGRKGLLDVDLIPVIPGAKVAGPIRTVLCGQDDNRGVHELCAHIRPGEIAVLAMPESRPVALIGDLLVTQLQANGAVAILTGSSVRDVDTLREMGLPIWARWVRGARGRTSADALMRR